MNVILNANGEPVSFGTVVAEPLPNGLTSRPLTETEMAAWDSGRWVWQDGAVTPAPALSESPIAVALAALEAVASLDDLPAAITALTAALADQGVI